MGLEPSEVGLNVGPKNPYLMQQNQMPSEELILETQKFVRSNPGLFEDLHKCVRDVMPVCFDGLKVVLNKGLSQRFQVAHSFILPASTPGKYGFSSTFVGENDVRVQEASPVLMAEMDSSGSLNFQTVYYPNKRFRGKVMVQTQQSFWNAIQIDQTYFGEFITANMTVVNPNPKLFHGIVLLSMLARVHENVDAGIEFFTQRTQMAPPISFTTLGLRVTGGLAPVQKTSPFGVIYPSPKWTAVASASLNGIRLGYHRNCSENIQSAVEFEYSVPAANGEVNFGYKVELPKTGFTFHASVNNSLTISSVVEKRLRSLPVNFNISASLGYNRKNCVVGFGVNVG